jgi:hypothetical protein
MSVPDYNMTYVGNCPRPCTMKESSLWTKLEELLVPLRVYGNHTWWILFTTSCIFHILIILEYSSTPFFKWLITIILSGTGVLAVWKVTKSFSVRRKYMSYSKAVFKIITCNDGAYIVLSHISEGWNVNTHNRTSNLSIKLFSHNFLIGFWSSGENCSPQFCWLWHVSIGAWMQLILWWSPDLACLKISIMPTCIKVIHITKTSQRMPVQIFSWGFNCTNLTLWNIWL